MVQVDEGVPARESNDRSQAQHDRFGQGNEQESAHRMTREQSFHMFSGGVG
jgi:hypothetical protein